MREKGQGESKSAVSKAANSNKAANSKAANIKGKGVVKYHASADSILNRKIVSPEKLKILVLSGN